MGLLTNRRVRNRRFDYEPRFYNPEKDERMKWRMRVGMRANRRRKPSGIIFFAVLFCLVLYIYTHMG